MVKSEDILSGLQSIVADYSAFAILWHVLLYSLIAALILRWEPSNKVFLILLSLPLLSVAIFAWIAGNPFNGSVFIISAILLLIFGLRASDHPVTISKLSFMIAGIIMIIFGLLYPHFINPDSPVRYLYASPAGLIPCPTISVVIGFILLFSGFDSRSVTLMFIIIGLFYGVFGVFRLGVRLDIFLIFGALMLLIKYILSFRTTV